MKITTLSKLALVIAISSSVMLEGCKKYDDDITRLQQGIDQNKSDIASLKSQLTSLGSTNVVESVTSIAGGFKITFKKADGTTFTYDIVNGAKGADGAAGKDGAAGTMWKIDPTTFMWQSSNDGGKTWTNTTIKAQGTNGTNGTNGTDGKDAKLEIKSVGGKYFWFINDVNTNVAASTGDVTFVKTAGGYNVAITDSTGAVVDNVFLATEAIAVSSMSLVPEFTNSNSAVVFFPRIVDNNGLRNTVLQGYAKIKYNLNPFGVAVANYDANGLLVSTADKVQFRSSGETPSSNFVSGGASVKSFGDIVVKYKPTNANSVFPHAGDNEDLMIALQIKNNKAASNQQYVASEYELAKEEIVERDETTIEKSNRNTSATGDKVTLLNGVNPSFNGSSFTDAGAGSQSLAFTKALADARSTSNFSLHFKNDATTNLDNNTAYVGGTILDEKLNGFYARTQIGNKVVSMDDHGLDDYNLRYDLDHYAPTAQERDWITLDPVTGKISVKISTNNGNVYNSAAVNNFVVIRVRMFPAQSTTNAIAERFIKVNFVQDAAVPVAVNGVVSHDVIATGVGKAISWSTPLTLDAAYNKTQKTASDFHQVYTFTPSAGNPAGITFDAASMNNPVQGSPRNLNIANTVMPGTYTMKGTYNSSISSDPVVQVTVTVTVTGTKITNISKRAPFWDSGLNYGIINGKLVGGTWKLQADLWDYWIESTVTAADKPATTYDFTIIDPLTGFTIASGSEVVLNEALLAARNKVNNGNVTLRVTRRVNGVVYEVSQPTFPVRFINPVKPIATKTPYKEFKDKEVSGTNTSTVDARRLIKLTDFNNVTLFDFNNNPATNVFNAQLAGYYGLSGVNAAFDVSNITFIQAENASGTVVPLQSGARAVVNGNDLVWENLGANLQQPIYLVYEVKVTNKFNIGDVAPTKGEVITRVKIKVNPNL